MEFFTPSSPMQSFYLTLMTSANQTEVMKHDVSESIAFINPNYIISCFHIMQGVNRACYNFLVNKAKSKSLKKEIIHSITNCGKLNDSLTLHSSAENKEQNYYILFIIENTIEEVKDILEQLGGSEISTENYSKLVNFDKLIKAFDINQCELADECENGIFAAIYNRIATKDLK